jgi:hypothetical protein
MSLSSELVLGKGILTARLSCIVVATWLQRELLVDEMIFSTVLEKACLSMRVVS